MALNENWISVSPGEFSLRSILQVGQVLSSPIDPSTFLLRDRGPFHGMSSAELMASIQRNALGLSNTRVITDFTIDHGQRDNRAAVILRGRDYVTFTETIYTNTQFLEDLLSERELQVSLEHKKRLFVVTKVRKIVQNLSSYGDYEISSGVGASVDFSSGMGASVGLSRGVGIDFKRFRPLTQDENEELVGYIASYMVEEILYLSQLPSTILFSPKKSKGQSTLGRIKSHLPFMSRSDSRLRRNSNDTDNSRSSLSISAPSPSLSSLPPASPRHKGRDETSKLAFLDSRARSASTEGQLENLNDLRLPVEMSDGSPVFSTKQAPQPISPKSINQDTIVEKNEENIPMQYINQSTVSEYNEGDQTVSDSVLLAARPQTPPVITVEPFDEDNRSSLSVPEAPSRSEGGSEQAPSFSGKASNISVDEDESPYSATWEEEVFDFPAGSDVDNIQYVASQSDGWFSQWIVKASKFVTLLGRTPPRPDHRVKIAILDTGIDLDHPLLKPFQSSKQISPEFYRNFVTNKQQPVYDGTGHGTHCAHVILKTCPNARVFVARVFESSKATEKTPERIQKAIKHCLAVWQVDIISMAFAFTDYQPAFYETIRQATVSLPDGRTRPVLFFAAASNLKHNEALPVGFPARMDEVVAVFSCKYNHERSVFSPIPISSSDRFAVPGELVQAAYTRYLNRNLLEKRLSGTSVATAMMAGIAGLVLEYCKVMAKTPNSISFSETLWSSQGMRGVFRDCMTQQRRGDHGATVYHVVQPWLLFEVGKSEFEISKQITRALLNSL